MKQEILDKYIDPKKGIWLIFSIETYAQLNGWDSPYAQWVSENYKKKNSLNINAYEEWLANEKCTTYIQVTGEDKTLKVTGSKLFFSQFQKSNLEVFCFFKENKLYLRENNSFFTKSCFRLANGNLISVDLKNITEFHLKRIFELLEYSDYYYENLGQVDWHFGETITTDATIFPHIMKEGKPLPITKEDFFLSIHGGLNQFYGASSLRNYSYYFEKFLQCAGYPYEKSFYVEEERYVTDEEMETENLELEEE